MNEKIVKFIKEYSLILLGSALYAAGMVIFIFPQSIVLGGTSGISVILTAFLPFSPGTILAVINVLLLVLAFFILGKEMAVKTFVGSMLTTVFVSLLEALLEFDTPLISNPYISTLIGAAAIAVASGIMFYVDSSSGGTDIVALIVQKFSSLKIGRALFLTDILIVTLGGIVSSWAILLASSIGFLVKVLGIDGVIWLIKKATSSQKTTLR